MLLGSRHGNAVDPTDVCAHRILSACSERLRRCREICGNRLGADECFVAMQIWAVAPCSKKVDESVFPFFVSTCFVNGIAFILQGKNIRRMKTGWIL